jgi:hypothetical protein
VGGALNTWQIIKTLARDLSFDRKKFLFFLAIFVVALGGYGIWKSRSQPEAAVLYDSSYGEAIPNDVKNDITIAKNGQVTIDGKTKNNALRFYKDYDEFSLIAFDSPIGFVNSYQATVHIPEAGAVRQIIYAVHGVGDNLFYQSDPKTLVYEAKDISPGSTLTIVARLPKGMVNAPLFKSLTLTVEDFTVRSWLYLAVALPILTMILLIFIYWRHRSEQNIFSSAQLSRIPDKIPPALAGVVIDGSVGPREIAATLIDLAARGYIFIINDGNGEFNFGKRRFTDLDSTPGLSDFEKALLSKIFLPEAYKSTVNDVEMRIGRHIFSRKIADFYIGLYDLAMEKGYFVKNPARVHLAYKYTGIVLFFLSFLGFVYGATSHLDPKYALIFWLGGMAAAILITRLAPYMPALTGDGIEKAREWMAFREYLGQKDSVSSGEMLEGKLNQYLPYAIVLGVEVDWIKRFRDEPFAVPDWYESEQRSTTIEDFASNLFPIIGYVSRNLARSHDPTTE